MKQADIHLDIDATSRPMQIPAEHPSLPGHFPGQPVVPAVVGLQAVCNVLQAARPDWQLTGIRQAKFMSPLMPEEEFVIALSGRLPTIDFQCHVGERLIAKGKLQAQALEQASP